MDVSQKTSKTYRPSRALIPFGVFFLLLSAYIVFQLLSVTPFIVVLILIPFIAFVFWWFGSLLIHVSRFSVTVGEQGIMVTKPAGPFSGVDTYHIAWEEITAVSFSYDKEINPQHLSGRNTTLTFSLKDETTFPVHQITILEQYGELFENIQKHIPFTYVLPKEHLWESKYKYAILAVLTIVCIALLLIFFS